MASNIDRLIAALGLDAEGEVALRRVKEDNNIRDNDPDVLAALAIARVDQTLREKRTFDEKLVSAINGQTKAIARNNEVISGLSERIERLETTVKNG